MLRSRYSLRLLDRTSQGQRGRGYTVAMALTEVPVSRKCATVALQTST